MHRDNMCLWMLTDSSNLEIFLEMLNEREIIIVVSHDEASTKYVGCFLLRCLYNLVALRQGCHLGLDVSVLRGGLETV